MSEKTVMIVSANVNPNEIIAYEHYTQNVGPLFKKGGGTLVSKYQLAERITALTHLAYQPGSLPGDFPRKAGNET